MPSKKKKYNARFPPARIKKIMQADDEVGKVAAVVPVIISKTLEIFVESLLRKACQVTKARNARTLTPAHLKASINSESQFSFLREVVSSIPDINTNASDDDPSSATEQGSNNNLSNARVTYGRKASVGTSRSRHRRTRAPSRKGEVHTGPTATLSQDEDEDADDLDDLDDEDEDEGSSCDNSNATAVAVPSSSTAGLNQQSTKQQPPPQSAMSFTPSMYRSLSCQSSSSTTPVIINKADMVDDDYDNI